MKIFKSKRNVEHYLLNLENKDKAAEVMDELKKRCQILVDKVNLNYNISHKEKYNTGLLDSFITTCKLFVK